MSKTEFTASANVRVTIEVQNLGPPVPQWPEPRPIEEAPKHTGLLAWFPGTDMWNEGWELVFLSDDGWSTGREGHQPTHFLPLPPKPEVRK